MAFSHPIPAPCQWFPPLTSALDQRSTLRLARLFLGAILARGRRAVTTWIRAAGLSGEFQRSPSRLMATVGNRDLLVAWTVPSTRSDRRVAPRRSAA
jgi:hypothetical protein